MQLARFPRQNESTPCSWYTLETQSPIPLYLTSSEIVSYSCNSILTRSAGATAVFPNTAEMPPDKKSVAKDFFTFPLGFADLLILETIADMSRYLNL